MMTTSMANVQGMGMSPMSSLSSLSSLSSFSGSMLGIPDIVAPPVTEEIMSPLPPPSPPLPPPPPSPAVLSTVKTTIDFSAAVADLNNKTSSEIASHVISGTVASLDTDEEVALTVKVKEERDISVAFGSGVDVNDPATNAALVSAFKSTMCDETSVQCDVSVTAAARRRRQLAAGDAVVTVKKLSEIVTTSSAATTTTAALDLQSALKTNVAAAFAASGIDAPEADVNVVSNTLTKLEAEVEVIVTVTNAEALADSLDSALGNSVSSNLGIDEAQISVSEAETVYESPSTPPPPTPPSPPPSPPPPPPPLPPPIRFVVTAMYTTETWLAVSTPTSLTDSIKAGLPTVQDVSVTYKLTSSITVSLTAAMDDADVSAAVTKQVCPVGTPAATCSLTVSSRRRRQLASSTSHVFTAVETLTDTNAAINAPVIDETLLNNDLGGNLDGTPISIANLLEIGVTAVDTDEGTVSALTENTAIKDSVSNSLGNPASLVEVQSPVLTNPSAKPADNDDGLVLGLAIGVPISLFVLVSAALLFYYICFAKSADGSRIGVRINKHQKPSFAAECRMAGEDKADKPIEYGSA